MVVVVIVVVVGRVVVNVGRVVVDVGRVVVVGRVDAKVGAVVEEPLFASSSQASSSQGRRLTTDPMVVVVVVVFVVVEAGLAVVELVAGDSVRYWTSSSSSQGRTSTTALSLGSGALVVALRILEPALVESTLESIW